MREISPRASELVRTLQQSATLLERLTRRTLDPAILAELEELADVHALPHVVALALSAGPESRRHVASVAAATWRRVPPASLLALDESYRVTWWTPTIDPEPWARITPADIGELARVVGETWALLAPASLHSSGRVRESAVRALDKTTTGDELPFLIVRLNDWVDIVAQRAREAVMRRVAPEFATAWARNLTLVLRLAAATRRNHSDVVQAVYGLLRQPSSRDALEPMLASDDRSTQRAAYRLARDGTAGEDRVALVRRALLETDSVIRFEALRHARDSFDDATLAPFLEQAAGDPFMPMRRYALVEAMARYPETAGERARVALFDRNPAVREAGHTWLTKHEPQTSAAELYRRQLKAGDAGQLVASIAGLAETGEAADTSLILPLLPDPRSRVRREAIRALGRLDAPASASWFTAALSDASPKVAGAAREVLTANPSLIDLETIRATIARGRFPHTRIQAVRLAATLGKWTSIQLLLDAARVFHPEVRAEVQDQVKRWLGTANLRFTAPKPEQVASIIALLNEPVPAIDANARARVRGFLGPWMPNAAGG